MPPRASATGRAAWQAGPYFHRHGPILRTVRWAQLEQAGFVQATITQNVDGLHQQAGSRNVVDLHGRLDEVICMGCGTTSARATFQHALVAANPTGTTTTRLSRPMVTPT